MKWALVLCFIFSLISRFTSQELIDLAGFQKNSILSAHNKERELLNLPGLQWSDDLSDFAADWALELAEKNNGLRHRKQKQYGENIAFFHSENMVQGVLLWLDEKKNFENEVIDDSNYKIYGHYSQMVWKNSTELGCACAKSAKGTYFLVCNYNPPGNYLGQKPY